MKHTNESLPRKLSGPKSPRHCVQITVASLGCLFALMPLGSAWAAPQPLHAGTPTKTQLSIAQTAKIEQPAAPMTVLAMIKAENDVLAKFEASQKKVIARAHPKPALLSIYGVLPHLRATVLVNGQEVVFEQGRKQPIYPETSALRLRHIKPPCVSYTHHTRLQTVCLSRVGL